MNRIIHILFFFFLFGSSQANNHLPAAHEFHVSRCLVEYNTKDQAVQITLNIFIDDLESALAEQGAKELFIGTEREVEKADQYIAKYIEQRLFLSINETDFEYEYLGKETSDDLASIWCYLEIEGIQDLQKISISYSLLMELYDDQKNIINVIGPQKEEDYFLFTKGKTFDEVQY